MDATIRLPQGFKAADLFRMAESVGCKVVTKYLGRGNGIRYELQPVSVRAVKS